MRCVVFAPLGGQTILDGIAYKDKFKEARNTMGNVWYYYDIPFNMANLPY